MAKPKEDDADIVVLDLSEFEDKPISEFPPAPDNPFVSDEDDKD